ncbi:MAG: alanine/glycine:cation symporter family protein [Eubacteriales bacterium]|nr:alanine/glycine:cation symporter family protein [Eubacteriales bacterium]
MDLATVLSKVDDVLYTWLLIYLLAGSGIYFSIRTRFVQIRRFRDALKCMMEKKEGDKGVSSFQALMIATASRVGTGNMAGVATAIILGGPGAAFWMWLMAVLGSASAFVESTLAQIYKKKEGDTFKGGPAFYIERALHARWLGIIFAISLIATFAFGFNGLQAYNIVSAFAVYTADIEASILPTVIGVILALASLYIFFAGDVIGRISSVLVPAMAGLYIAVGIFVILTNITRLPGILSVVMADAFNFKSIFGGFTGSCMVLGIKRGLFSNEAGMGSAPNASASATVSHPAKQGLAQIISVYIDTLLICSTTVFLILLTGDWSATEYSGIPLLQQCVARVIGPVGIHFVTVIVCLFAFTSIIGNYFYAEANILFITENPLVMKIFRVAAAIMVFIGAGNSLDVAWSLADITMGLEAVVNIIAIVLLGKIAFSALDDYESQMARGIDPVFHESNIGLNNTDVWKD